MADATVKAIAYFKADNLETETKEEIVKKLAERKIKFIARPSGKKVQKQYKDSDEELLALTREAMEKTGLKPTD